MADATSRRTFAWGLQPIEGAPACSLIGVQAAENMRVRYGLPFEWAESVGELLRKPMMVATANLMAKQIAIRLFERDPRSRAWQRRNLVGMIERMGQMPRRDWLLKRIREERPAARRRAAMSMKHRLTAGGAHV